MSEAFLSIQGGGPLKGIVKAAGAKNAITKLLVASLLSDKLCIFYNVPNIGDVEVTVALCRELGSHIHWDKKAQVIEIQTKELKSCYIPQRFSGANRIPILLMGALLGRTQEDIMIPTVGGCKIGKRSVDFHLDAIRSLGAHIEYRDMKTEGAYLAQAHKGLQGNIIKLPYPSVGASENSILAAVRAQGKSIIENIALEPEVLELILFLQKLGAHIAFKSARTLLIEGSQEFREVQHTVMTDRIEAASYGMAAVASKGRVFVKGAKQEHMVSFLYALGKIGGGYRISHEGIEFFYQGALKDGIHLETDVAPGFLTDWQQPFVVLLTQTQGVSIIHETVYENRFGYTKHLQEMGANLSLFEDCLGPTPCRFKNRNYKHSLVVQGPCKLQGQEIHIPDLRAGFAYVLSALIAKGTSSIYGLPFLRRGYEDLEAKLLSLGAKIQLVEKKSKKEMIQSK